MTIPPRIPLDVLFGNPQRFQPQISPDGRTLAYVAPYEDVLNVWIQGAEGAADRPLTREGGRGVRTFYWSQDSREIFFPYDVEGREIWRLAAVDVESGHTRYLTLPGHLLDRVKPRHDVQFLVARQNPERPEEVLLAINLDAPQVFDMYRLDVKRGDLALVAKNPGNFSAWLPDRDLQVRLAMAAHSDGSVDVMMRRTVEAPWTKLLTFGPQDAMSSSPLGFTADGTRLWMIDSRDANTARLVQLDPVSGAVEVIAADDQYDVSGVLFDQQSHRLLAVSFIRERLHWQVVDDSVRDDFERLSNVDDGDVAIVSRSRDGRTWIVEYERDNGPKAYYRYDRDRHHAQFLFEHRSNLRREHLARMEPIGFDARDGLHIHGYITFPVGRERRGLPMVLLVHGGPWSRHRWGFDPVAQWLANRGYVCLEVNFRGSTGYGKDFLNAGDREWGGKIQHDLEDAVHWAMGQGFVDPNRIAIVGASFGGYSALMGAASTPDLFRCAVDAFGPTNLVTFLRNLPPSWAMAGPTFTRRIGDPVADEEMLLDRSPLLKVDRIKIPILVAQGAKDIRVLRDESEAMVAALRNRGVEHEYLLFEDEGHAFHKPGNRLTFYATTEKFLATHMQPGRGQVRE